MGISQAIAGGMAGTGVASIMTPALAPVARGMGYSANRLCPNLLPSTADLIRLFQAELLTADQFKTGMGANGAFIRNPALDAAIYSLRGNVLEFNDYYKVHGGSAWAKFAAAQAFVPPLQLCFDLLNRGIVSAQSVMYWFRRLGIHQVDYQKTIAELSKYIPPVQDMIRFAVREVFNQPLRESLQLDLEYDQNLEFQAWARASGLRPVTIVDDSGVSHTRDFAKDYWAAHWQHISPSQAYEMLHRLRPERMDRVRQLVPAANEFGFESLATLLKIVDYAPQWRANLAAISYRIPTRVDVRRLYGASIIDRSEVVAVNRDMGYDAFYAEKLADLADNYAFWNPTISLVRRWFQSGRINQARALGYLSRQRVKLEDQQLVLNEPIYKPSVGTIQRWLRKNIITAAQFNEYASQLGIEEQEATRLRRDALDRPAYAMAELARAKIAEAYKAGVINKADAAVYLGNLGLPADQIEIALKTIDTEVAIDFGKKTVAAIRKEFLRGIITLDSAKAQLSNIGIFDQRITDYIKLWLVELNSSRRLVSAQTAITAYSRGLISQVELQSRLFNLNYSAADVQLYMNMGQQQLQLAVARAAQQASRTEAQKKREAERIAKALDSAQRQAIRDMLSHGSLSMLAKWLKHGRISESNVRTRLRNAKWPLADIDRFIAEAMTNGQPESNGA